MFKLREREAELVSRFIHTFCFLQFKLFNLIFACVTVLQSLRSGHNYVVSRLSNSNNYKMDSHLNLSSLELQLFTFFRERV